MRYQVYHFNDSKNKPNTIYFRKISNEFHLRVKLWHKKDLFIGSYKTAHQANHYAKLYIKNFKD